MRRAPSVQPNTAGLVEKYTDSQFDRIDFLYQHLEEVIATSRILDLTADSLFFRYEAIAGQTVFTGPDLNNRTMTVPGNSPMVYVNRVLADSSSYVLENANTQVRFLAPLEAGDLVHIASFAFNPDGTIYYDDLLSQASVLQIAADAEAAKNAAEASAIDAADQVVLATAQATAAADSATTADGHQAQAASHATQAGNAANAAATSEANAAATVSSALTNFLTTQNIWTVTQTFHGNVPLIGRDFATAPSWYAITHVDNNNDAEFVFRKARGGVTAPGAIAGTEDMGTIRWQAYDGTTWQNAASIVTTVQAASFDLDAIIKFFVGADLAATMADNGVVLYHMSAQKLITTVNGISVTGLIKADTISGNWLATQAEAEAGVLNTKVMTPLSVKQARDASDLGRAQTWQNMLGSRSAGTSYQNTTSKPIQVAAANTSNSAHQFEVSADGSTWVKIGDTSTPMNGIYVVVPVGHYYRLTAGADINYWAELR